MDRRAGETVDHGEGPAVLGRPPGARGEHGCRVQRSSKGLKATRSGEWGKVVGLRTPSQTKEQ